MCENDVKEVKRSLNSFNCYSCNVCQSMSKGLKVEITFDPFNIHGIGWYGWKGLSLSFPKLFPIENPLNIKEVMSKNVYVLFFNIT